MGNRKSGKAKSKGGGSAGKATGKGQPGRGVSGAPAPPPAARTGGATRSPKKSGGAAAKVVSNAPAKGREVRMLWIYFALGAALCWGCYGPSLHAGQTGLGSPVRALLFVGVAYFLVAVLVPGGMMLARPEVGSFAPKGVAMATFAGILGAAGAVCIILAFKNGGSPAYVMPLVFGCAPVVNVLISMAMHPPKNPPNPLLYVGFALASIGAFLVLRFKPQ